MVSNIFAVSRYFIFIKFFIVYISKITIMSSKQNHNAMSSYSFTKNGYHYFLVADGDGFYRLHSDADYLQYLQANETKPGIITSITNGEIVLLTRGETFGDRVVTEIQRIEGSPTVFKVKLSEKEV